MRNSFFAAAMCAAATLVFATSCSGPLAAGEDLEQIGITAEKQIVDVENFSEVEASKVGDVTFRTSDGNVLKANVVGVTPRIVILTPGEENANARTINVKLVGENNDGVQRIAYTSYQQRKSVTDEPVVPSDPTVIDIRLEADTTMVYRIIENYNANTGITDYTNQAMMRVFPVRRITTYSDGTEKTDTISKKVSLEMFGCTQRNRGGWVSDNSNPAECVFWNGMSLSSEDTVEYPDYKQGFEMTENIKSIYFDVTAISDASAECQVGTWFTLITRKLKFTDSESGLSIEWNFSGEVKHVGNSVIDEQLSAEQGKKYCGTYVLEFDNICNGKSIGSSYIYREIYNTVD